MTSRKAQVKKTSSRKKKGAKGDGQIVKCVSVSLAKKKAKDRKAASITIKYETASGIWSISKPFSETMKFIEQHAKDHKQQKSVANAKKYRDDFLLNNKNGPAFKMIKDVINGSGKNKKTLTDSKFKSFIGAKRDNLSDIKESKKLPSNANSSKKSVISIGSADDHESNTKEQKETETDSASASDANTDKNDNKSEAPPMTEQITADDDADDESHQEELEQQKRKHLAKESELKSKLTLMEQRNFELKQSLHVARQQQNEDQTKITKYEEQLGKNALDDEFTAAFGDDVAEIDAEEKASLSQKYFLEAKELKKRNEELLQQLQHSTDENGDLKKSIARAEMVAKHMSSEVLELKQNADVINYNQLMDDYNDVEAELDEAGAKEKILEVEIVALAQENDKLTIDNVKMKGPAEEYPNLVKKVEELQEKTKKLNKEIKKMESERDDFEDAVLENKKKAKDLMPKERHEKEIKSMNDKIKEVQELKSKIELEKEEVVAKMEKSRKEIGDIKGKLGQLSVENEKLLAGGGQNINLNIDIDFENDFSLFKKDEFEFPNNISRAQLMEWVKHFKLLIREINNELCSEINSLSTRTEELENYIESKGLPFPEDDPNTDKKVENILNNLPHPLPSMNFNDNLDEYNPTKQQLKDYINLMFNEWRRDEYDLSQMLLTTQNDIQLLNELENGTINNEHKEENGDSSDDDRLKKLKQKLEESYLKQEEKELEFTATIKDQKESLEQLQKQLMQERQKNRKEHDPEDITGQFPKIDMANAIENINDDGSLTPITPIVGDDMDYSSNELTIQQLKNQISDQDNFIKSLEDDKKCYEFEADLQRRATIRDFEAQIKEIQIDFHEAKQKVVDLLEQINSDDLNLTATQFREDAWEAREERNNLEKSHIEEIRELEKSKDELLREVNILRVKNDRLDRNQDDQVSKIQYELDKKDKELQHFMQVSSNLSHLRDQMENIQADRDQLEISYKRLNDEKNKEKDSYLAQINELISKNKELLNRIDIAEKDIMAIRSGQGGDGINGLTQTEIIKIKEQLNDLTNKRNEAIKSKIKLLQNSSLEIERLRDEIKLLSGNRKISLRDFKPNRYGSSAYHNIRGNNMSSSTLGSNIPLNMATHQQLLNDDDRDTQPGFVSATWLYTMGMLSSFGKKIRGDTGNGNTNGNYQLEMKNQEYSNDNIYSDYGGSGAQSQRSSVASNNIYGGYQDSKHQHSQSRAHAHERYSSNHNQQQQISHGRGPSNAAINAKKRRYQNSSAAHIKQQHNRYSSNSHNRHQSSNSRVQQQPHNRHSSNSHNNNRHAIHSSSSNNNNNNVYHGRNPSRHGNNGHRSHQSTHSISNKKHRPKQPTKESLINGTDNPVMQDSFNKIFEAFDKTEMVAKQSYGGDMGSNQLQQIYNNDNSFGVGGGQMNNNIKQNNNNNGNRDDFWEDKFPQNDEEDDENNTNNQYYDDDNYDEMNGINQNNSFLPQL